MSEQTERSTVDGQVLIVLIGLLVAGACLMYLGRAVILYQGSWLSGGFGGIAVLLGTGDVETARGVMGAVIRREPTLAEKMLFYSGAIAILLNVVEIRTGVLTRLLQRKGDDSQ